MVKRKVRQRFIALLCAAGLAAAPCSPAIAAGETDAAGTAALETEEIAAIDFSTMENLDSLNGWTIASGAGTATLEDDPKQGKVLKLAHPSNGAETNLVYDSLGINEDTYRYVSVETVIKLGTEAHANQFSIPYLSDSAGKNAYTLLTEGDWSEYKCHVNNSSTKLSAGSTKLGEWQTVCMDIDLKEDTFRVSVDGEYLLAGANAREKVTNLNKIRYFADSWNTGTMYIKSAKVTAYKERTQSATFYVAVSGDDGNDGQSPETAWTTIDRVNREHFIPGDKILFERNGVWENQTLQPQGSGTKTSMITLGSYGDKKQPRPQIAANAKKKDALFLCNQQYWEISELDVSNTAEGFPMATNGITPAGNVTERTDAAGSMLDDYRGIHIAGRDIAELKGFRIHDVKVHDVTGHVTWIGNTGHSDPGIVNNGGLDGSKRTGGLLIECLSPTKGIATQFSDVIIEKSEFINNSFSGIAIKQWHGEGDQYKSGAWDTRNGAGGAPDYYDANWKPHSNIIVQDNYINQGASAYACNGIYLTSVKDSLVQRNVLEHIGTCGIELYFADNVAVQYNEVSDVAKKSYGADDNAIDPDWRVTNALIQYNYVHDCGEGFLLCGVAFNSGVIRYNLAQNCTRSYVHYSMGSGYFQIYNNVFYRSTDAPENATNNFDPWGNGTASYFNNVFYDGKGEGFNFSGGTSFAYHNNAYFKTAAPSKETNPIILTEDPFEGTAPSIDRYGSFKTGVLLEANGLRPRQASALIASGVNKDSNNISIEDGLMEKGTKFNFTPLAAMNANESWKNCVNIERKDYPMFTEIGDKATFNTAKPQAAADENTPTIGMFEVAMDASAISLRGTVTDKLSNALANTTVTVIVGGKTITTQTNEAGAYLITEGLEAGEATVSAGGKTITATLTAGKMNIADITTDLADMPAAYEKTVMDETFDSAPKNAFVFDSGSAVENGKLVITKNMGNAKASAAAFPSQVSGQKAIDFSFDWNCDNANKMGFEFRDSYDRLLFAVCAAPQKKELRTSTTGGAVDSAKAADKEEPKWSAVTMDSAKTYTFRIHADFTAKKVSFCLSEKNGEILAQKLNISTDAVNLAKMNACSWWDSKPQYIDNFVMTAPEEVSLPLAGKTIYAFGDSIVAGHQYEKASFINFVAGQEGMAVQKFAVNGATILNANYSGGQILAQLEKAPGNVPDYVIFDGGTNDAEYLVNNGNIRPGTVLGTPGSSTLDTTTFAGAFEQTIVRMQEKWPNAQIIYVAVHKMGSRDTQMQEQLHDIQMLACAKYGVAVANIYEGSELDTTDANQKNTYTFDSNGDNGLPGINGSGTHPNLSAIEKFYVPIVAEAFRNPQVPDVIVPVPGKEVVSIWVSQNPAKTEYLLGEALDTSGLEIEVTYSDNSKETVSKGFRISGYQDGQTGEQTITVTYQGKSTVFQITVKKVDVLEKDNVAISVPEGSNIDLDGASLETNHPSLDDAAIVRLFQNICEMLKQTTGITDITINKDNASATDIRLFDKNNEEIQPDGDILITIPKPEGYGKNIKVYVNTENGPKEISFSIKDGNLVLRTDKFGTFAIVDLGELPQPPQTTDKSALKTALDAARLLKQEDYTPESFQIFLEAWNKAESVYADENASQAQIDEAATALADAQGKLKPAPAASTPADKAGLKATIAEAGKLDAKKYTAGTWQKFQEALNAAKAIDTKADATPQEIPNALNALNAAKNALQEIIMVKKVTITNGRTAKIAAGKKISLKAAVTPINAANTALSWKSSNTKWASVNNKGVVTTKKAGKGKTVTITAAATDGSRQKASFKIKIMKNAVSKVSFKAKTQKVKAGKKITLKPSIKTTGGKKGRKTANTKLAWKSSNKKWATVSSKGVVTTKKAGKGKTVTITATSTDGTNKKASIKIKINKK